MYGFVANKKDYRMERNPNSIAINIGELLWKYWCLYLSFFFSIKLKFKKKMDVHFCFLCTQKKWVHSKIGQCVRPAVRSHDNFRQCHPIELKFCTQNCLINISVEFEDENDPSRNDWAIEKIVIIDQTIPEGGYRDFFSKKIFFSELFKTYMNRLSF